MRHRKATTQRGPPAIGATALRARSLAPDLARGAMLLLIALANAPLYLYGDGGFGYEPERHRRLLRRTAVLGVGLAAAGGLLWALVKARWWQPPSAAADAFAGMAHTLTGYAGGAGYAAAAGLVALRVRGRPGRTVTALVACGQRSLTCYLLQSVVFVAVLAAYGGGLGDRFGLVEVVVLAVLTWLLTVLLAGFMRRRGYRGPAEVLLRRLTYRPIPYPVAPPVG